MRVGFPARVLLPLASSGALSVLVTGPPFGRDIDARSLASLAAMRRYGHDELKIASLSYGDRENGGRHNPDTVTVEPLSCSADH
jgi:hypothetical protein